MGYKYNQLDSVYLHDKVYSMKEYYIKFLFPLSWYAGGKLACIECIKADNMLDAIALLYSYYGKNNLTIVKVIGE